MTDAKVEFRRFHHVTIAVDDLDAAVNDWTERLRWPPAFRSSQSAAFALDDSYVELVPFGVGTPGVRSVSVVVDHVGEAAAHLKAKGASFAIDPEGHVRLDPGCDQRRRYGASEHGTERRGQSRAGAATPAIPKVQSPRGRSLRR